jgi:hypothetical protein
MSNLPSPSEGLGLGTVASNAGRVEHHDVATPVPATVLLP